MRSIILSGLSVLILGTCALLSRSDSQETVKVQLQLVDADTGKPIPGLVRVFVKDSKKAYVIQKLVDRLKGLKQTDTLQGWRVLPNNGASIELPKQSLRIQAISGIETTQSEKQIDLTKSAPTQIKIPLKSIFRPEDHRFVAGNTHLHLRNMTKAQADVYLRAIPPADRLKVLFISYLERFKDDKTYITNEYAIGDLPKLQTKGMLLNNGEEHRHNFEAFGQGYGHVMFLNINKLIKPVSLGPGITGKGNDDQPLSVGIAQAKKQGGTVIWCHNTFGYEDIPHALAGHLDAVNVFDGSRRDKYDDTWYHLLNIGLKLPISTGTDWHMYDWSRVYAQLEKDETITIENWLKALRKGRNFVTNGPALILKVSESFVPGDQIQLTKSTKVPVVIEAIGRHDFGRVQLIHNGKVIASSASGQKEDHFRATIKKEITIRESGWLAARIDTTNRNEFEQGLFAHTSPVYVNVAGSPCFQLDSAQELIKQLDQGRGAIREQGKFTSKKALASVLQFYDQTIQQLQQRINDRR